MKYIVEVREPVPSNLDEIAGKVAASFHITDDKALALLRRAPGAMTRAVSEREADVVAGIFERAGLNVVKRPAEAPAASEPPTQPAAAEPEPEPEPEAAGAADEPAAAEAERTSSEVVPGAGATMDAAEVAEQSAAWDADLSAAPTEAPEPAAEAADDVWDRPLGESASVEGAAYGGDTVDSFSRRDGFEAEGGELGWDGDDAADVVTDDMTDDVVVAGAASDEPRAGMPDDGGEGALDVDDAAPAMAAPDEPALDSGAAAGGAGERAAAAASDARPVGRSTLTPETVRRSQTPETLRSTLTRAPSETKLQRGGLRRRVANAAILPALLTLIVTGVAMLVTVMPLLRAQQEARAAAAAHAEAATLEALTGGMPLTAQTLSGPLTDLARRSQAVLGGNGVRSMTVTDATGVPVAGWYGPAITPAALPPDVRRTVSGRALDAVAGQAPAGESFTDSLLATWHDVLAMLGLGSVADRYGAAPVLSAGQAVGAVVVAVEPASASSLVQNAFLTTLLVGLVPVLIAILVAMGLTRGLRAQVAYLLEAADRISRGDLEESVELDSRDELGQLARAIERMRVSLQEGMERLRRRR